MVKYSVIMPVFNVEAYLDRSIKSIINQKYSDWELLIVNDGSTDNSQEICERYSGRYQNIVVFNQENQGSGVARELALNNAKGEYICFVDPDDYLSSNALVENLIVIDKYKPDIIMNGYTEVRRSKNKKMTPLFNQFFLKEEFRDKFSEIEKIGSRALWNKLYKLEYLRENNINFSSQRVGQDALFNYSAFLNVESIYINQNCYYFYDTTREGSAVKMYRENRFDFELNIAKKYEELFQQWNKSNKYKTNINLSYWKVVFAELLNITYTDSPFDTLKKQIYRIKILKDENNFKISSLDTDNLMYKLTFLLYKKEMYFLLILLMRLYSLFRKLF